MARRRRRNGRPTVLDQTKQDIFLNHVRLGERPSVAALLTGLSPKTVEEWRRRGEGRDPDRPQTPIYEAFANELAKAEAFAESGAVQAIRAHMPRDYNAAKFWLQTRRPEVWGDKVADQLAASGGVAGPVITGSNVIVITPERARLMGSQLALTEGTDGAIPADYSILDELAVGPDADQR